MGASPRTIEQMHDDTPRRRQIRRLLKLRERHGLTFPQLSVRSGIPVGTLQWWSHRLRGEAAESNSDAFVELGPIEIGDLSRAGDAPFEARLSHASGWVIELRGELASQVVTGMLQDVPRWS